jgi:ribonuclease P protein component
MSTERSLGSKEKLKSRKAIQAIFEEGKSVKEYPIFLFYQKATSEEIPMRIGFSVSKRNFKSAVDRNRVKRLMREAYRLNKSSLVDVLKSESKYMNAMFVYSANRILPLEEIEKRVIKILSKLEKRL